MGCDVGITWHTDENGAQATAEEIQATGRRAQVRRLDLTIFLDTANVIDELADQPVPRSAVCTPFALSSGACCGCSGAG